MIRGMNPGGIVLSIITSVMIFSAFAVSSSYCAESSQKPLSFSNKDLEPYENSADHGTRGSQSPELKNSEVQTTKAEDAGERKQKESWCKKATPQRKKIQRLSEEIDEKERELAEENSRGLIQNKKTRTLNKELVKIRKRLKDAEGNFGDLESEAYRKGVPAGWLRCQFE